MKEQEKGISVIICCYNSEERLPKTLEHIFAQKLSDGMTMEVLIIDNASKDNTTTIAQELWDVQGTLPQVTFQVVPEMEPGLSYAREKGMSTSSFEYLLFCDDDNWFNEDYVQRTYTFLKENKDYGAVGGNGNAACEITPPAWFEKFSSIYALGCRNDGDVTNVYGAGMGVKKSLIQGYKTELSDRKGSSLASGGDSEWCMQIRKQGYKIRQVCDNTFFHFIPKERLTTSYLYRLAKGRGMTKAQLKLVQYNQSIKATGVGYRFRTDVKVFWKALLTRDRVSIVYTWYTITAYWKSLLAK
jgi:glycosyltransferase involved in cell wall biosynthesis